jgi:hypothetical protein
VVRPYDLTRWRSMASHAHRHELSEPVRRLCDEVELLQRDLKEQLEINARLLQSQSWTESDRPVHPQQAQQPD